MDRSSLSDQAERLITDLEDLTGQPVPFVHPALEAAVHLLEHGSGIGLSQLNELLLLLGYDRIASAFFQFLTDGRTEYVPETAIRSLGQLEDGISRFRKLALLFFGNVKYAFKNLSRDSQKLRYWLSALTPREEDGYASRHEPVHPVERIPGEDTYYLGYIVQRELASRLQRDPDDAETRRAETKRQAIVEQGIRNHEAYLASDHLDVYVATSMRERHEYLAVSQLTAAIFQHTRLLPLKLRWFDPTQAYCRNRVDKGLAEALMLKRAKCTLYFVQEADTLGKDSELASTLAQGKPVIAFVPQVSRDYVDRLLDSLKSTYPAKDERSLVVEQLRLFDPAAAWKESDIRGWLDAPDDFPLDDARSRLFESIQAHYDRRARTLREDHPLGIQVNLSTGVANGVLVVRTVEDCAELIWRVVTRNLEFEIESVETAGYKYVFLREKVSDCIFRVMTGDLMLTNTFWNFYLNPSE